MTCYNIKIRRIEITIPIHGRGYVFKVGDKAVYPMHGVGVIESIDTKEIGSEKSSFFVLKMLGNGMKIMIPEDNIDAVGLRQVMGPKKIKQIYKIFREHDVVVDNQTWNRPHREYLEKIRSGSPTEIAKVLKDLWLLKKAKDLSFDERKMFDMAYTLLIKEISVAKNVSKKKVEEEFQMIIPV